MSGMGEVERWDGSRPHLAVPHVRQLGHAFVRDIHGLEGGAWGRERPKGSGCMCEGEAQGEVLYV